MTAQMVVTVAATVAALFGLVAAIGRVAKFVARVVRFLDDWQGEDARDGFERRPGVLERLATVEQRTAQLTPNGGAHMADRLERIERKLTEHIDLHTPPGGIPPVDGEQ